MNSEINLKESSILYSTEKIKDLYKQLNDSRFSRSAPIPVLQSSKECFVVLKPKLRNVQYGDIKVEKMEMVDSLLNISYKEIENFEYKEKKQSNPVLILKIFKIPNRIKLYKTQ
ncbi:hypothetical protein [Chryseobacterium tongliaoense]|uniref:hypothetical protein n=1 Tax=Chryseobacterium tongliaoense TaxID=3240933 RepID=UPI003515561A